MAPACWCDFPPPLSISLPTTWQSAPGPQEVEAGTLLSVTSQIDHFRKTLRLIRTIRTLETRGIPAPGISLHAEQTKNGIKATNLFFVFLKFFPTTLVPAFPWCPHIPGHFYCSSGRQVCAAENQMHEWNNVPHTDG